MNINTSLVTDTSEAVAETSVDAYRDQISDHIDNDLSGHTSVKLYDGALFYEQGSASTQYVVGSSTLRMLLTDSVTMLEQPYALPAIVIPGVYIPAGSAPVILRQPLTQTAVVGSNVVFTVYIASSSTVTYQWIKNGVNISETNRDTLTLINVQISDAASYTCKVSNAAGVVTSTPATLAVTIS